MENCFTFLHKRKFLDALSSEELLQVKGPVKVYVGFDPTSDSLHLGNLVGIIALKWLQKMGHKPYILLGGATGRIGDPSGKSKERPLMEEKTLQSNLSSIRKGFEKWLDFSKEETCPVIVNNEEWFSSFSFLDFLREVGKNFRVGSMVAKESVKQRMQSEEGISYTEFSYQVLQAYDFYHLYEKEDVSVQLGGSDQWGNITAGIELIRKKTKKSAYGATFPLLVRADGKKFGKTEEGAVWLSCEKLSPYNFYQYLLRVQDEEVNSLLRMLTFLEEKELLFYEKAVRDPSCEPNIAQKKLAEEVTRFVHGEKGLEEALQVTEKMNPGKKTSLDKETLKVLAETTPTCNLKREAVLGKKYTEVLQEIGLVSSRSEAVKLIKNQGAYLNNEKVSDVSFCLSEKDLLEKKYLLFASGKKRKLLVEVD